MRVTQQNIEGFAEYVNGGRVVVFDTETTGGSCADEICQLAAAEYVNGRLERTLNLYLRPTCEMNPWAEQVYGISMDYLDEHGIDPVDALRQFFDFLGSDVLLVAHNNRFDIKMHPVFRPFDENWLFTTNMVSQALVSPIRSRILADGIPATSFAAGANSLGNNVSGNIDYATCKSGEWPRNKGRWLHSDTKKVAFFFNHLFFKKLVNGDNQ